VKKLSDFVWWNKNRPNHSAAENAQIAEPFEELDDQVPRTGKALGKRAAHGGGGHCENKDEDYTQMCHSHSRRMPISALTSRLSIEDKEQESCQRLAPYRPCIQVVRLKYRVCWKANISRSRTPWER
jgi:hypothetical protein